MIFPFKSYEESINECLEIIGLGDKLPQRGLIILKPNLTNDSLPPITTDVRFIEEVLKYCIVRTKAKVVIAEGCGNGITYDIYRKLGYTALSKKYNVPLVDLNEEKVVELKNLNATVWKIFYCPEIIMESFLISLPVLKDHLFTVTTLGMKNMFGIAPSRFYSGTWNKSRLHNPSTHISIVDICRYKKPDFILIDGSYGMKGSHLNGKVVKIDKLIAGFDPVTVDAEASYLLGHNPRNIEYLVMADGVIGELPRKYE